ncbi:cyclase [Micromonospora zingiberis]|uniref:Cyclase n=1 Tax=Micromonospora zingiberis TaxID=2053011 RepID=A0A4R0GPJ1_9ACTN|nr:SRPBCC family protein [Micromonospora zingiberis]TCB97609.1 cyclase [Micromonospora zingiberis]
MPRIELTTDVQATPETVFDACLDVDLHTESMGASAERAIGGVTTGRLTAGDAVTWQARHFGLPWRMTVRITDYRRPYGFTDEQVSGPFGRWRHEHRFTPSPVDSSATVMRDVIEFTAPLGPVGGVVASVLLRPYLQRLIARRNAHLAATLAGLARAADEEPGVEGAGDAGA